jgi:RHS repeat-associated protein
MTVSGQSTVRYTYDDANRLTQITQAGATATFAYDSADRRTSVTLPNGVSTEYTYDAAGQLTGLTYKLGGVVIGNLTYTYDSNGRRLTTGGSFARTRLPQAVASATYNAANQLTTWAGTPVTYDLDGNISTKGGRAFDWNARNQLAAVSGNVPASFQYDGLGRRINKTVGGAATDFLYDGSGLVQELVGLTPTANLLNGPGVDEILSRTEAVGTRGVLADALGSTIALTDEAGSTKTQYTYEPFGATAVSGDPRGNSSQFSGREADGTGLYYYRSRYYDSSSERFASEDPLGIWGGDANLFAYVANEPTDLRDPMGLGGEVTNGAGGAAVGFGQGLLDALRNWNNPTKGTQQARLGRPNPEARYGWERSFHLDCPDRFNPAPHLNAEFGPLKSLNHADVPRWVYPLGSTRALRVAGRAAVVAGVALDAYDIMTAGRYERGRAIGGAVGGWGGGLAGAEIGSLISPGVGTVIGGVIGGVIGSAGGQAIGGR